MRIALINNSPAIVDGSRMIDIEGASDGRFTTTRSMLDDWAEFQGWANSSGAEWTTVPEGAVYGPPVPQPRQIFAVGLNYLEHRREAASDYPIGHEQLPLSFTKFPSSITGPTSDVLLPSKRCDFEVELVVVIGAHADGVSAENGWAHVAGLTIGQDISDRSVQYAEPAQLSLSKSFRTFSPIGPVLVTPDEFADPADLAIECLVNGEITQSGRTSDLIYGIGELIALYSSVTALYPGDLIFTGTPMGVGHRQQPARFLQPGDVVVSRIEGIGEMSNGCVSTEPWQHADRVLDDAAGALRGW